VDSVALDDPELAAVVQKDGEALVKVDISFI
jgi:hypothetical protein